MKRILALLLAIVALSAKAQQEPVTRVFYRTYNMYFDEYQYYKYHSLNDTLRKFCLGVSQHNFLKNNEYFGDFVKGYTLIGFSFQPEFTYNLNPQLSVQAMWNVLKYHGYDDFSEYKPYMRIVFRPSRKLTVIGGYLEGNVKHEMLEPIYNPERFYTDNVENGLQLLVDANRYQGDTWLNWEKFILWGDPWKEKLTFGHHSKLRILGTGNDWKVSLDGQLLISHRGGQIDSCENVQLQTLENGAIGLDITKFPKFGKFDSNFRSFSIKAMFVQYHAIDETVETPYVDGWGAYLKALLKICDFGFSCGYWDAHCFMNFRGDPLFTCVGLNLDNSKKHRQVLFNELYYYKSFYGDCFRLRGGVNTYYDINAGNLEYSFMFGMLFKQKWNWGKSSSYSR